MLLGSLARFYSALKEIMREVGVEVGMQINQEQALEGVLAVAGPVDAKKIHDDLGEVIERGSFGSTVEKKEFLKIGGHNTGKNDEDDEDAARTRNSMKKNKTWKEVVEEPSTESKATKRPKKKRKKGDTFDDLFGSLI
jgi:hypothetical protein